MPTTEIGFRLVPRRRVVGMDFGTLASARRGRGTDVIGARAYSPGDDMRAIDWAASARLSSARGADEFIVRESWAEDSPTVVVVLDSRPDMALYPPALPWLGKARAARVTLQLIAECVASSRGSLGLIEHVDGAATWLPPRAGRDVWLVAEQAPSTRFAPEDVLDAALDLLQEHRRALLSGSFIFVLSDFLAPVRAGGWADLLERGWDLVPVVIQDPFWERSFPDVADIVVPFADPGNGRVHYVRFSRAEVQLRREEHERRFLEIIDGFWTQGVEPIVLGSEDRGLILRELSAWTEGRLHGSGAGP
jgi:uncharacterized protein (DUF58 family)